VDWHTKVLPKQLQAHADAHEELRKRAPLMRSHGATTAPWRLGSSVGLY